MFTYVYIYIYTYIYREREIHIYIYIYMRPDLYLSVDIRQNTFVCELTLCGYLITIVTIVIVVIIMSRSSMFITYDMLEEQESKASVRQLEAVQHEVDFYYIGITTTITLYALSLLRLLYRYYDYLLLLYRYYD